MGKGIGNSILSTRDVDDVTGELRDVVKLHCCLVDQGGEERYRVCIRGLCSVKRVKSQPSRRKRK